MSRNRGFTLIELMIVIAIIAIIASIAIPGLLRARMSANERSASASLRSVVNGEEILATTDADKDGANDYWTGDVSGLYFLSNSGNWMGEPVRVVQDMPMGFADLNPLFAGRYGTTPNWHMSAYSVTWNRAEFRPKSGYWYASLFDLRRQYHTMDYAFVAVPSVSGRTGENAFLVNSEGTVYRRDWFQWTRLARVDAFQIAMVDTYINRWPTYWELASAWEPAQ